MSDNQKRYKRVKVNGFTVLVPEGQEETPVSRDSVSRDSVSRPTQPAVKPTGVPLKPGIGSSLVGDLLTRTEEIATNLTPSEKIALSKGQYSEMVKARTGPGNKPLRRSMGVLTEADRLEDKQIEKLNTAGLGERAIAFAQGALESLPFGAGRVAREYLPPNEYNEAFAAQAPPAAQVVGNIAKGTTGMLPLLLTAPTSVLANIGLGAASAAGDVAAEMAFGDPTGWGEGATRVASEGLLFGAYGKLGGAKLFKDPKFLGKLGNFTAQTGGMSTVSLMSQTVNNAIKKAESQGLDIDTALYEAAMETADPQNILTTLGQFAVIHGAGTYNANKEAKRLQAMEKPKAPDVEITPEIDMTTLDLQSPRNAQKIVKAPVKPKPEPDNIISANPHDRAKVNEIKIRLEQAVRKGEKFDDSGIGKLAEELTSPSEIQRLQEIYQRGLDHNRDFDKAIKAPKELKQPKGEMRTEPEGYEIRDGQVVRRSEIKQPAVEQIATEGVKPPDDSQPKPEAVKPPEAPANTKITKGVEILNNGKTLDDVAGELGYNKNNPNGRAMLKQIEDAFNAQPEETRTQAQKFQEREKFVRENPAEAQSEAFGYLDKGLTGSKLTKAMGLPETRQNGEKSIEWMNKHKAEQEARNRKLAEQDPALAKLAKPIFEGEEAVKKQQIDRLTEEAIDTANRINDSRNKPTPTQEKKMIREGEQIAAELRARGIKAEFKSSPEHGFKQKLFIDGKPVDRRSAGLVAKTEKVPVKDLEFDEEARKPFKNLTAEEKESQLFVAKNLVDSSDLPAGYGDAVYHKGVDDLTAGKDTDEARLVRQAAIKIAREGKDMPRTSLNDAEYLSPEDIKQRMDEDKQAKKAEAEIAEARKKAGITDEDLADNELPFSRDMGGKRADDEFTAKSVELINKVFPDVEFVTDSKRVEAHRKANGIPDDVLAWIDSDNKTVYLSGKVKKDSPFHEVFGHAFFTHTEKANPALHKKILANMEDALNTDSALRERLQRDYPELFRRYEQGDKSAFLDEVWANIIGKKMVDYADWKNMSPGVKKVYRRIAMLADEYFKAMRAFLARQYKLRIDPDKDIRKFTVEDFVNKTAKGVMKGGQIRTGDGQTPMRAQIGAYHGSPYDFDKFDSKKIGTGEGHQAFGHGLYFTDLKGVAEHYANMNVNKGMQSLNDLMAEVRVNGKPFIELADYYREDIVELAKRGDKEKAISFFVEDIAKWKELSKDPTYPHKDYAVEKIQQLNNVVEEIKKGGISHTKGRNLYEVTLHKGKTPEQYNWLEWSRPLKDETISKIDGQYTKEKGYKLSENIDFMRIKKLEKEGYTEGGAKLYNLLSKEFGSNKAASEFLLRAGIDGIKYPAESIARGATSDNARGFNYVVFDDKAVTIENKIRFQIAGESSLKNLPEDERKVRQANLETADAMTKAGKDAKTVWMATGWEQGKDGKWRYEIPDFTINDNAKAIIASAIGQDVNRSLGMLEDVISGELLSAYPELKRITVSTGRMTDETAAFIYTGQYGDASISVAMDKVSDIEHFKSVLTHEVQHAIQRIEGFAGGSSPTTESIFLETDEFPPKVQEEIRKVEDETEALIKRHEELKEIARNIPKEDMVTWEGREKYRKLWDELDSFHPNLQRLNREKNLIKKEHSSQISFEKYKRTAGETEARNAQTRAGMTAEERRNTPLSATEDTPRDKQIVRFQKAETAGAVKGREKEAERLWREKGVESPFFKKWFRDSKVVDENGKPLVVYHGTDKDFSMFDVSKVGRNTGDRKVNKGSFFTSDPSVAETFLYNRFIDNKGWWGREGSIIPVYLSMKNPKIIDAKGKSISTIKVTEFDEINGTIIKNVKDSVGDIGGKSTVYHVVDPTQIKSATGNKGTFDSSNPDIRFQKADEAGASPNRVEESVKRNNGHPLDKAPNGKESILYKSVMQLPGIAGDRAKAERFIAQVYSDNFKKWFGDWQNDPKNASKVVDENGMPLLVEHGSRSKFTVFDIDKAGKSSDTAKLGFWFSSTKGFGKKFVKGIWYGDGKRPVVYNVFLDIKNPKIYETKENNEQAQKLKSEIKSLENQVKEIEDKYTAGYYDWQERQVFTYAAGYFGDVIAKKKDYYTNRTPKSAEAISDGESVKRLRDEIKNIEKKYYKLHYSDAYEQLKTDIYELADKTARDANVGGLGMILDDHHLFLKQFKDNTIKEGYDGIIIKNTRFDSQDGVGINSQYLAFDNLQIKSVFNAGKFSESNPDIRFERNPQDKQQESATLKRLELYEQQLIGLESEAAKRELARTRKKIYREKNRLGAVPEGDIKPSQTKGYNKRTANPAIAEDIAMILDGELRESFDKNRNYTVTNEQTLKEGAKLAETLTDDDIMSLEPGTIKNSTEATGYRIYTEARMVQAKRDMEANPNPATRLGYQKAAVMYMKMRSLGTEGGRLVQSFAIPMTDEVINTLRDARKTFAEIDPVLANDLDAILDEAKIKMSTQEAKAVAESVKQIEALKAELEKQFEVSKADQQKIKELEDLIEGLKKVQHDAVTDFDADIKPVLRQTIKKVKDPALRNHLRKVIAKNVKKPGWGDYVRFWYINALLSHPLTHAVNFSSNLMHIGAEGIPMMLMNLTQSGQMIAGAWRGFKRGKAKYSDIMKGKAQDSKFIDNPGMYDPDFGKGNWAIPTKHLTASDALFREIAKGMYGAKEGKLAKKYKTDIKGLEDMLKPFLTDEKYREWILEKSTVEKALELAQLADDMEKFAEYVVFQSDLGKVGKAMQNLSKSITFILPFVKTPANIFKVAKNFSPLGFGKLYGKKAAELSVRERQDFTRRAIAGTMFYTAIGSALASGLIDITGEEPRDQRVRDLWKRQGYEPFKIYFGNTGYDYRNISPVNIGLMAIGNWKSQMTYDKPFEGQEKEFIQELSTTILATAKGFTNQSYLQGISSLMAKIREPESGADYLYDAALSMTPSALRLGKQAFGDDTQYQTDGFMDKVEQRFDPSPDLLPRRDVFGEIKKSSYQRLPIPTVEKLGEKEGRAVEKFLLENELLVGYPSKATKIFDGKQGGSRKMTAEEYDRYLEISGKEIRKRLEENLEQLKKIPADEAEKQIKRIVDTEREIAKYIIEGDIK